MDQGKHGDAKIREQGCPNSPFRSVININALGTREEESQGGDHQPGTHWHPEFGIGQHSAGSLVPFQILSFQCDLLCTYGDGFRSSVVTRKLVN